MSQLKYNRGDAIPFCLIDSDSNGVTGINLIAADVQVSSYDDVDDTYNTAVNIGLECSEGDNGFYYWKPAAGSQIAHSKMLILILDSVQDRFVQNRLIIDVGGDPAKLNSRLRG